MLDSRTGRLGGLLLGGLLAIALSGCPHNPPSGPAAGPTTPPPTTAPTAPDPDETPSAGSGQSGVFDYYVLSLSWSPQFCYGRKNAPDDPQCGVGRGFGFVVHGLWPQYDKGYPESCPCPHQLSDGTRDGMLHIMPSSRLVEHEWQKHGTCSGLTAERYFEQVRSLHAGLTIPEAFRQPSGVVVTSVDELKQQFVASNPHLVPESLSVYCSGAYVRELRICLGKDLKPMPCGPAVRDRCRAPSIQLRPLRNAAQ